MPQARKKGKGRRALMARARAFENVGFVCILFVFLLFPFVFRFGNERGRENVPCAEIVQNT